MPGILFYFIQLFTPSLPASTASTAATTAAEGSFAGKTFRLPGLQEEGIVAAAYYLDVEGTEVIYNGTRPNP